jgi:hypothetical protein
MIGFGEAVAAKRMDARGFVSKKARLEKPDRKKDAPWLIKKRYYGTNITKLM